MARYKMNPFVSVIDGQLKTGKTDIVKIPVKYEPKRRHAGVDWLAQPVPVNINGKKIMKRFSAISLEYEL